MRLYLAQSYHEYFERTSQSLYKSKKVKMPKPELYMIYTGNKGRKPDLYNASFNIKYTSLTLSNAEKI